MILIKKILIFSLLFSISIFATTKNNSSTGVSESAVVFMYHRFDEQRYPSTNITLEQFAYQLEYLEKNNYTVWPLSKVVNYISNKKALPPNTVSITMDDAYASVFTKAYPMLREKNFPFTVFVNTKPIDNKSKHYMRWEQMRIMQKNGAEFANHSSTHPYLLDNKRITKEIVDAQIRLKEELGESTNENPKLFSYPFGEYSLEIANLVKSLGYIGITQLSGAIGFYSDFKALTRFAMSERFATEDGFKIKINTIPLPIKSTSSKEPLLGEINPPTLRIKLKHPISRIGCFLSNGERIKLKWLSKTEFEVVANQKLKAPRERYTCTAPANDKKWYWYSHLWIIKK